MPLASDMEGVGGQLHCQDREGITEGSWNGRAVMARAVIERIAPVPDEYRSEYLRVNAGPTYLGTFAKATRELGWVPRPLTEGFEETLRAEVEALRAERSPVA